MLTYPEISPVAVSLGPVAIHWYGLMYLIGFIAVWWLGSVRARKPGSGWKAEEVSDLLFYGALGVILGGRIGYVIFYNFNLFLDDPLMLLRIWQGGMSFHGGMLGVFVAMGLFGRKTGRSFFQVTDFMAPFVPIGLGAGRIGNFINGELWGRPTDLPWGMVFPFVDAQPRHPSMLYEALLEGLMLLRIWQGGMSFHGGMLGVFVAMGLFGRKTGRSFFQVTDFMAPFVPIGLGAGRIGNFINGELWGRPTDLPWGMVFPFVDTLPRHPSMLYEALLEGLVLFVILWLYSSRPRPFRAVSGMFMLCYGVFRFAVEFVREPDEHLGYIALDWVTMGHLLSLPMILFGVFLLLLAYSKRGEA